MSNQINLKGVLCTLLLFFFLLPSVQADTLVVNKSAPACTTGVSYSDNITDALLIANQGDTIKICEGAYRTNLQVNEQVNIIGQSLNSSKVILYPLNNNDHIITINNNSIGISYITLKNLSGVNRRAIHFSSSISYNTSINNIIFIDIAYQAIYIDSPNNTINNNIFNISSTSIQSAEMIAIQNSPNTVIRNNVFYGDGSKTSGESAILWTWYSNSINTVFSNNTITVSNTEFLIGTSQAGNLNQTYSNNFFNISTGKYFDYNSEVDSIDPVNLNTTLILSTNIVDGGYIGGNFYAFFNGTGYSELCNDSDMDGICDNPLVLNSSSGYIDFLPLSNQYTPIPTPTPSSIEQSFGNISEVLHETPRIIPPLVSLLFYILIIILLFIVIKFYKQILENITNIISDIGR